MLPSKTRDFNIGDLIELKGTSYEVTGVSEKTVENEVTGYAYTFRPESDVEEDREADRKEQADLLKRLAAEAESE